jgi:hypothetical protein
VDDSKTVTKFRDALVTDLVSGAGVDVLSCAADALTASMARSRTVSSRTGSKGLYPSPTHTAKRILPGRWGIGSVLTYLESASTSVSGMTRRFSVEPAVSGIADEDLPSMRI